MLRVIVDLDLHHSIWAGLDQDEGQLQNIGAVTHFLCARHDNFHWLVTVAVHQVAECTLRLAQLLNTAD